jgi:hypothetical protein
MRRSPHSFEARGLRRDDVHPDVYVTTHREFVTEYYGYAWPGWGYGYWGITGTVRTTSQPIVSSTLFVDIRSAETGELLWRGISERDVQPDIEPRASPEAHQQGSDQDVQELSFRNRGDERSRGADIRRTADTRGQTR